MVDYETLLFALTPLVAILATFSFWLGRLSNEQKNQRGRLAAIEEGLKKLAPHILTLEYLQRSVLKRGFGFPDSTEGDELEVAEAEEPEEEASK